MKFFKQKSIAGFTLIEALLYLAIAGTVLYFISGFAFNSLFGKAKIETIQGVNENSLSVLNDIGNTVSGSMGINGLTSPAVGCVATSSGTVTYTDSSGLNPRSSPPYTGGYTVHTFTTGGTFTVSSDSCNVQALVVAGGGGGGSNYSGGGGGAGGYQYDATHIISAGPYSVSVGNGGPAGTNGNNSVFGTMIAYGGGHGATYAGNGFDGASGGGASGTGGGTPKLGGNNSPSGQGNPGGTGWLYGAGGDTHGGGGGGSSATGSDWNVSDGKGGDGTANSISGASVTYAGGGGGGSESASYNGGAGGAGGGGAGSKTGVGTAGTNGLGGGGGGAGGGSPASGAAGGSGIVIVRYLTAN